MRTTSLAVSLIVGACAPIGQPGHHGGGDDGPDAGTIEATCDSMATKTMNVTYTGTAIEGLPSTCWKLDGKSNDNDSIAIAFIVAGITASAADEPSVRLLLKCGALAAIRSATTSPVCQFHVPPVDNITA